MASSLRSYRAQVERQIAFGTARGLTETAKKAAQDETRRIPSIFDRPTPFTQKSIGFTSARRDNPVATVFVKDVQAKYLTLEETGGPRAPRPGAPVNIPAQAKLNSYGNLPRRQIKTYRNRKDVFFADGAGKTAHLKPGVYQRAESGERRKGGRGTKGQLTHGGEGKGVGGTAAKGATSLKLLVAFKPIATYRPRFGFVRDVTAFAKASVGSEIAQGVRQAFATAR